MLNVVYNEYVFKHRVDKALEKVKTILDNTRNPQYPTDVHHEYSDKYILSEFLGTSCIASFLSSLEYLGLTGKAWEQVKEWSKTRQVTLRLRADESCKFLKKVTRDVESDTKNVTKVGIFGKLESFTVTKVTEYLWDYTVKWELVAFVGVDSNNAIVLQSRTGTTEVKTSVETAPKPETLVRPVVDVNITWLLHNTDDTKTPRFTIDRKSEDCRTPRRNPQVEDALEFLYDFHSWVTSVCNYFLHTVFPEQYNHGLDLSSLNANSVFVPVIPLFEDAHSGSSSSNTTPSSSSSSSKVPPVFMNSFLAEQSRSLEEKRKDLAKTFTQTDKLITITEANVIVILQHLNRVSESYSEGVDYIEDMLYKQLVAAIGKVVTPVDFSNYLAFHNRKIFNQAYRPQLFSYAVRRPDHYPEGVLSIEAQLDDGTLSSPITTIVAHSRASRAMKFALNAATKVSFFGDRYVHGYVSHQFAGLSGTELSLYARARQFSSFILLVGRIASADLFEPKYATIIQNKDELKIPLLLETIPTPKEFKDAIASLSPEQQRFCKAFRSMQLESTLFGVCVIQIKPQLEKLLKLPDDSLTKEIQLSENLLELFIKYQIPSDLVSYDGDVDASVDSKIGKVKEYTKRMNDMLDNTKKLELEEAQKQQQMRLAQEEADRLKVLPTAVHYIDEDMSLECDILPQAEVFRSVSKKSAKGGGFFSRAKSPRREEEGSVGSAASFGGGGGGRGGARLGGARPMAKQEVMMDFAALPPPPKPVLASPASNNNNNNNNNNNKDGAPPAPASEKPQQEIHEREDPKKGNEIEEIQKGEAEDYTKIPTQLEAKFEQFDESNALRPTIINPGETWSKTFYKSLLSEAEKKTMGTEEQGKERNKAFDLLDALTKSGALSIDHASLHVVIAATHCFDKSIIDTVVQDNINPIEKVENSSLIIASTIHHTPAHALVAPEHIERVSTTSAKLINSEKNLIEM